MSGAGTPADAQRPGLEREPGSELGQGLVEYGLMLGLAALFTIVGLVFFGDTVAALLDFIARAGSGR